MKYLIISGALLFIALASAGCKLTRWGYESAAYKVIQKRGPFEVREYPGLTLVSTRMAGEKPVNDDSFMRLFRYISGANQADLKIAMTTPVMIELEGTNRAMSFVVPRSVAEAGAPSPKGEEVKLTTRSAGRFAVYRFRGSWNKERIDAETTKLMDWIASENLRAAGTAELASYDPPFTPPFLRRNEVLVRLSTPEVPHD